MAVLDRRYKGAGKYEILVEMPGGGQVWEEESVSAPPVSAPNVSQGIAQGRGGQPSLSTEDNWLSGMFREALSGSTGTEFGEDVPKGSPTFVGKSGLTSQFAKPAQMAPWSAAQAPSGYGQIRPKKKLFEGYKPWSLMG
jgi:hypothetical protein